MRRSLLLALAAAALAAPPAAWPRPSFATVDVETLSAITLDELVTCPLEFATYWSGGEGCSPGIAPASGECGLSHSCPLTSPTIADSLGLADHYWTQLLVLPIVLDLGVPSDRVFVFNAADHLPFPEESIEWTVWGSNGSDVTGFPAGWELGSLCAIFKQGWVESGACPGDDADDYTGLYEFSRPYLYVAVYSSYSITIFLDKARTLWSFDGDSDPATPGWQSDDAELDAVARPAGPPPFADAGPDRDVCEGTPLVFNGSASSGRIFRWNWDVDGDGVPEGTGQGFNWTFPLPGSYTVTLSVLGECGCDSDTAAIHVRRCPLAVRFGELRARRHDGGVEVEWSTLAEDGTLGFTLERAAAADGPFAAIPGFRAAAGAGTSYRLVDAAPGPGPLWYRVVESSERGRGDVSPALALPGGEPVSGGRARRAAR